MSHHAHPMLRRAITIVAASAVATAMVAVFPVAAQAAVSPATATAIGNAIAAPGTTITSSSFVELPPNGTPHGVGDSSLGGFPTDDGTFGILTTGDVNFADDPNNSDSTGVSDGGDASVLRGDTALDISVLKLNFTVPTGANCMRFDFKFFSDEFPEFVGRSFNDAFIAELDSTVWKTNANTIDTGTPDNNFAHDPDGKVISINAAGATSMNAANATGTTYDGATPLLTAAHVVAPGAHSLFLSIFDQGDHIYDSAVFLDNFVVGFAPSPAACGQGATVKSFQVTLAPPTANHIVGQTHTVTATVNQLLPTTPVNGGTVLFMVSGANHVSGTSTTDAAGHVAFSYIGTAIGSDAISACYDVNNNGSCDTGEATASATATWEFQTEPAPPGNDAGGPYTGAPNGPVTLAGIAFDPNGDPLTNTWTYTGPAGATCTFSDAHSPTATINCTASGVYTLTLTTSDGTTTVTDTATLTLTVAPPASGGLPVTGASLTWVLVAGGLLLLLGVGAILLTRRRRA